MKGTCRYTARGLFLDPPTLGMANGRWCLWQTPGILEHQARCGPEHGGLPAQQIFYSKEEAFGTERDQNPPAPHATFTTLEYIYSAYIQEKITEYQVSQHAAQELLVWMSCKSLKVQERNAVLGDRSVM